MSTDHDTALTPFTVRIDDATIADLNARLDRARWPDEPHNEDSSRGVRGDFVRQVCDHWRHRFDWKAFEARFNAYPQFLTRLDGEQVHFLHIRSSHENALPLLLTHGWPGSILEFLHLVGPLTQPEQHGAPRAPAFHLVIPSMPGYGFSGPTVTPGVNAARIARIEAALMARLGYTRYGAQGGDWGAIVTSHLGSIDAEHLVGIHINMVPVGPPQGKDPMEGVHEDELAGIAATRHFEQEETAYQRIQGTKPQTLAYALNDSPVGLAGWILEKFHTWSDCKGDPLSRFSVDTLAANLAIYWVTQTINSSMRLYWEVLGTGRRVPYARVEVPTACALFPAEIFQPPRAWAERRYHITRWTRMPSGGHFAALEEPELLLADIRAHFGDLMRHSHKG